MATEPRTTMQNVTEAEMAIVDQQPAIFANKIYVTMLPAGARIVFCEHLVRKPDDLPHPRTAVFLQYADLLTLHDLLARQIGMLNEVPLSERPA